MQRLLGMCRGRLNPIGPTWLNTAPAFYRRMILRQVSSTHSIEGTGQDPGSGEKDSSESGWRLGRGRLEEASLHLEPIAQQPAAQPLEPTTRQPSRRGRKSTKKSKEASLSVSSDDEIMSISSQFMPPAGLSGRAHDLAEAPNLPDASFNFDSLPGLPILRPYQREAIAAVIENQRQGLSRQLISMPTGAGKTITFCTLARILNCRTLVLVHREQLLDQTVNGFRKAWPEATVGVVQGKRDGHLDKQVVVATVQTASGVKRLERLSSGMGFGLCIVDEAHHTPARSYQTVLEALGFLEDDGGKLLLGVTATAHRRDKALLTDTFQTLAYDLTVGALIAQGYLCKVRARRIMTQTDISSAKLQRSSKVSDSVVAVSVDDGDEKEESDDDDVDFNMNDLSLLVNTPKRNNLVVSSYLELAVGRRTIAFCCSIQHAEDLASVFQSRGVKAATIHSKMPYDRRDEIMVQHRRGDLEVLVNVMILTEGYDDPTIACVLMTRPTRSTGLYTQCVGRGLRICEGKEDCLILDFTDKCHSLDRPSDLITIDRVIDEDELVEFLGKPVPGPPNLKKLLEGQEMELFGALTYAWIKIGRSLFLSVTSNILQKSRVVLQISPLGDESGPDPSWQLTYATGYGPYPQNSWTPIGEKLISMTCLRATQIVETNLQKGLLKTVSVLKQMHAALSLQKKDLPWRKDPATDKQLELLSRETGLPHDDLVSWASKGQRDGKIPAGVPPGTMRPVERRATTDMGTSATDEDRKDRRVSGKTSGALSAPQVKAGMTKGQACDAIGLIFLERDLGIAHSRNMSDSTQSQEGVRFVAATEPQKKYLRKLLGDMIKIVDLSKEELSSPESAVGQSSLTEGNYIMTADSGETDSTQASAKNHAPPLHSMSHVQLVQHIAEINEKMDSGALHKMEASRYIHEAKFGNLLHQKNKSEIIMPHDNSG